MKIIAKQIAPEWQESSLFIDGFFPDNIAVYGNRNFNTHFPEVVSRVRECLENGETADAIQDFETGGYFTDFYENITAAIIDLLPPEKPVYSDGDIQELKRLVSNYGYTRHDNEILAAVVSIVTGKTWETGTIRGCCQSDWQNILYPVDEWNKDAIQDFETEYFNTGTEWIITDEDGEDDFIIYCHAWNTDGIKQEIADASGASPDNITLLAFDGYKHIAQYKEVV